MRYRIESGLGYIASYLSREHTLNLKAFRVHHAIKITPRANAGQEKKEYYHKPESNATANITSSPAAQIIFTNIIGDLRYASSSPLSQEA